jgi:hypothetical protein
VAGISMEFLLMLAYAVFLAAMALLLEVAARHAHRRSMAMRTAGFTYHAERDIWHCPEEQHLFPVFTDPVNRSTIYRAPAAACNACRCKSRCTDSDSGREVERRHGSDLEYGMRRFHRAMSLTLLSLASMIIAVEFFRNPNLHPRLILVGVFTLFVGSAWRLAAALIEPRRDQAAEKSASVRFDAAHRSP